jgi:hypothetical protein
MARIEGRKLEEESLVIPPIRVSFPKTAYMMQLEKGPENFLQRLSSMNINILEENKVKGFTEKTESGRRDEHKHSRLNLPQLTI